MRAAVLRVFGLLALLAPVAMSAKTPQIAVEDSGSTNRAGLRVTFDSEGQASVEPRNGPVQHVTLSQQLCKRFLQDIETAGSLSELPAAHCFKSVSFGSRIWVEFNGNRSPDLSCPSGDARSQALQRDANELLEAARQAANIRSRRVFTIPAPHPQ